MDVQHQAFRCEYKHSKTLIIGNYCHLFKVNHLDLSPKFAGTLMGITSAIGNTSGFLAPLVTGLIVDKNV